jgi:hypothetical protein
MQKARLKVEAWMSAEGIEGRLVQADQCPTWGEYQTAQHNFYHALEKVPQSSGDAYAYMVDGELCWIGPGHELYETAKANYDDAVAFWAFLPFTCRCV